VGTIIKVSRLYETPAWVLKVMLLQLCAGFAYFLIGTKSVKSSFKIEKRLGRLRNKVQEYQSRTIDIDLIALIQKLLLPKTGDSASINAKTNFVLLPIQDLNLDWKHPILQKNIAELILLSQIKAFVRLFKIYEVLRNIALEQFNYVAFEGNIGAGKTTLATKFLRILMQNSFGTFCGQSFT
jgi:7,8-dihydro-6-hydroxymethylpterin-pyrophosphokinase